MLPAPDGKLPALCRCAAGHLHLPPLAAARANSAHENRDAVTWSVGHAETLPAVCWLVDLIDEGRGVVGARDVRVAVGVGEQDVAPDTVAAGGLARCLRPALGDVQRARPADEAQPGAVLGG